MLAAPEEKSRPRLEYWRAVLFTGVTMSCTPRLRALDLVDIYHSHTLGKRKCQTGEAGTMDMGNTRYQVTGLAKYTHNGLKY